MSRPFLLVQLSDPHIGADWAEGDPAARLAAAVESVRALGHLDAVLVSGDLADHASDAEYELVQELLAPLGAPLYVLAGNHDDRRALHRHFGVPGADGEPAQYSADLGPVRLVVLDSTRPGEDPGAWTAGGSTGSTPSWPRRRMCRRSWRCTIRPFSRGARCGTTSGCRPPIGRRFALCSSATARCGEWSRVTSIAR
jgi:3',5'-cyclic AMP phosphodiesterase CpdA